MELTCLVGVSLTFGVPCSVVFLWLLLFVVVVVVVGKLCLNRLRRRIDDVTIIYLYKQNRCLVGDSLK